MKMASHEDTKTLSREGEAEQFLPPLRASVSLCENRTGGSALVITLLVITVLAVIVISFLTSMSIERLTSNSYAGLIQAEYAVEAGNQDFRSLISSEMQPTKFYLIGSRETSHGVASILVLGSQNLESSKQLIPLVSADLTTFKQQRPLDPDALNSFISDFIGDKDDTDKTTNMNFSTGNGANAIDSSTTAPTYLSSWKYLTDNSGRNVARYAYYILDEQSKVNLAIAEGSDVNPRQNDVVNGSDIVISSNRDGFLNADELAKLQDIKASDLVSLKDSGQIFDSRERADTSREWMTYLNIQQPDLIPAGYFDVSGAFVEYPDAGEPKFNINVLATDNSYGATDTERAVNIAEIIDRNLPDFKKRDTSFGASGDIRYVRRIAASILDYIDTDSITTLLPDGEPAGMELQGVLAAIIEEYVFRGVINFEATIDHTVFVELWNPYTKVVTGDFRISLESLRDVQMPGAISAPLPLFEKSVSVSVKPNEFKVINMGTQTATYSVPSGSTQGPTMQQTGYQTNRPPHSRFKVYWNDGLCNWTPNGFSSFPERGPGLVKGSVSTMNANSSYWSGNLPQHVFISDKGYRSVADPRQNYSQNYTWRDASPTSANFLMNGRSNYAITGSSSGQDFNKMWIGRDYLPRSPGFGVALGGARPDDVPTSYSISEELGAPSVVANAEMLSIGELGNIYDPANVNEIGIAAKGGNPDAWSVSGGGRTLRLGQPERQFWSDDRTDNRSLSGAERIAPDWSLPGLGANHLLDLFTVKALDSSNMPTGLPRLNVNTANRESLISLFWNIRALGDPVVDEATITRELAEVIADEIISKRPYNNFSELDSIMNSLVDPKNYEPTLGVETFQYPSYLGKTSALDSENVETALVADRTTEGSFRRVVENMGITTKHLRVVIVGHALSPQGTVTAQARSELFYFIDSEPIEAADGTITYRLKLNLLHSRRL